MKKLKLSLIALALSSSAVIADPIFIDGDFDGDTSDFTTDVIDSIGTAAFNPVSYYVDEDGDGLVKTGDFVFDFGLDVQINGFSPDPNDIGDGGFGTDWDIVADYLIYGSAVVDESVGEIFGTQNAGNGIYDNFGTSGPGLANESLAANITNGIFNLFIDTDLSTDTDELVLGATYEVTSVGISGTSLDINVKGLYALPDLFYREDGAEFSELLTNGANWTGSLFTYLLGNQSNSASPIPGTFNPNNETTFTNAAGINVAHFGQNATQVTRSANDCPDGAFGYCSGDQSTIPFDPTTTLWRDVRDEIRDTAGNSQLLARTTTLGGDFEQTISAPGSLAILGGALLAFGAVRRKTKIR